MIPFDFEYYKPSSAKEAVSLFHYLGSRGKKPVYYAGGTEIISFSRLYQLYPQAVIDLKGLPECNVLECQQDHLVIGAAATLTQIQESNLYPPLSWCGGRVADHTTRGKITLGGNICATIPYRESVLALLVSRCEVVIEGAGGTRREPLEQVFNQSLRLAKGDLLLQVVIDKNYTDLPFYSVKRTANGRVKYPQDRIGYPLISAVFLKKDDRLCAAFSGVCPFPFRSFELENVLNDRSISVAERLDSIMKLLPGPVVDDMEGSGSYREFVFRKTISEALEKLEGVGCVC